MEELATTAEVAAYLRITPGTLANWASMGKGPKVIKIGGARRYNWDDVRAYVQERTATR